MSLRQNLKKIVLLLCLLALLVAPVAFGTNVDVAFGNSGADQAPTAVIAEGPPPNCYWIGGVLRCNDPGNPPGGH